MYIITKRTFCEHDPSTFVSGLPVPNRGLVYVTATGCPICGLKGYVDEEVGLDEALKDLGRINNEANNREDTCTPVDGEVQRRDERNTSGHDALYAGKGRFRL